MCRPQGAELLAEQSVFRLIRQTDRFIPAGKPGLNGAAFEPSSEDKAEAEKLHQPVRVSVWETVLTTVVQARAFRAVPDTIPYRLEVSDVIATKQKLQPDGRLRVVADPLLDDPKPGAHGHCGIEGLDRRASEGGLIYKALRDELALRARRMIGS